MQTGNIFSDPMITAITWLRFIMITVFPSRRYRDYLGHEYEEMTRQYVDYMPKKLEKASEAYFQEETHSFAAELMKGEFHG